MPFENRLVVDQRLLLAGGPFGGSPAAAPRALNCSVDGHGHGTYQWRKVLHGEMTIYQLPHFSRANSESRLAPCRAWFVREVLGGGH